MKISELCFQPNVQYFLRFSASLFSSRH